MDVDRRYSNASRNCFFSNHTFQWQPGKLSTFVLSVMEIEDLIVQLTKVKSDGVSSGSISAEAASNLDKQISNWQTVLTNYRAHNDDLTSLFTADELLFINVTQAYAKFQQGSISDEDTVKALESIVSKYSAYALNAMTSPRNVVRTDYTTFRTKFASVFKKLQGTCNSFVPGYTNPYLDTVCNDFNSVSWTKFTSVIDGPCDMPGSPLATSSLLRNSALFKNLCLSKIASNGTDIPGGVSSSGLRESMFGFLEDPTKYLTFGANAPITMTWTSTVGDAVSFSSNFASSLYDGFANGPDITSPFGILSSTLTFDKNEASVISIGKSSSQSHGTSRTITINLADFDTGKLIMFLCKLFIIHYSYTRLILSCIKHVY